MVTKISTVAILFIIYVATVFSTCRKPKNCSGNSYSFEIGARAHPDLDSVAVGDTLWVEVNESVSLRDINSNSIIRFSNAANLGTVIDFIELKGNRQSVNAANYFDFKLMKGSFIGSSTVPDLLREYLFVEENGAYLFKIGIIPKKMGIYRISLSDAANVYQKNDGCSKAFFRLNFKTTNQHLYYNELNFGIIVPLPNNGYCFKVK